MSLNEQEKIKLAELEELDLLKKKFSEPEVEQSFAQEAGEFALDAADVLDKPRQAVMQPIADYVGAPDNTGKSIIETVLPPSPITREEEIQELYPQSSIDQFQAGRGLDGEFPMGRDEVTTSTGFVADTAGDPLTYVGAPLAGGLKKLGKFLKSVPLTKASKYIARLNTSKEIKADDVKRIAKIVVNEDFAPLLRDNPTKFYEKIAGKKDYISEAIDLDGDFSKFVDKSHPTDFYTTEKTHGYIGKLSETLDSAIEKASKTASRISKTDISNRVSSKWKEAMDIPIEEMGKKHGRPRVPGQVSEVEKIIDKYLKIERSPTKGAKKGAVLLNKRVSDLASKGLSIKEAEKLSAAINESETLTRKLKHLDISGGKSLTDIQQTVKADLTRRISKANDTVKKLSKKKLSTSEMQDFEVASDVLIDGVDDVDVMPKISNDMTLAEAQKAKKYIAQTLASKEFLKDLSDAKSLEKEVMQEVYFDIKKIVENGMEEVAPGAGAKFIKGHNQRIKGLMDARKALSNVPMDALKEETLKEIAFKAIAGGIGGYGLGSMAQMPFEGTLAGGSLALLGMRRPVLDAAEKGLTAIGSAARGIPGAAAGVATTIPYAAGAKNMMLQQENGRSPQSLPEQLIDYRIPRDMESIEEQQDYIVMKLAQQDPELLKAMKVIVENSPERMEEFMGMLTLQRPHWFAADKYNRFNGVVATQMLGLAREDLKADESLSNTEKIKMINRLNKTSKMEYDPAQID